MYIDKKKLSIIVTFLVVALIGTAIYYLATHGRIEIGRAHV